MFVFLLGGLLAAASVHIALMKERTLRRVGELALLYVLVGYCGVPMLILSVGNLMRPDQAAHYLGFPAGNPFQDFLGVAYLGMSLLSIMALWYRRTFLIGPAVLWAVFFVGATLIHMKDFGERGALTHGSMLAIFASHGLISVLLAAALIASGVLQETARAS